MSEKRGKQASRFGQGKNEKVKPEVVLYLNKLAELGMSEEEIAAELANIIREKGRRKVYGVSGWVDDDYDHPLWQQTYINNQREKQKEKKGGHAVWLYFLLCAVMVHLPAVYGLASAWRWDVFATGANVAGVQGILLVGLDNEGEYSINTGNADSITYVGANWNTRKAITLPIYHDANIMQTCTGTKENVNQIYRTQGITCLVESVAQFLMLPIDYYALVTIDGLINIVNSLGSVGITPSNSYCSTYGEDGQTHCFIAGQTQQMNGHQALAYLRYRGNYTGEERANRQMELMYAVKDHCAQNVLSCYFNIPPEFAQGVRMNIPLTHARYLPQLFSDSFELRSLEVLAGSNGKNANGNMQTVSKDDLLMKTKIIREEIFSE